ncbi:zf-TFIIB domain-containing protein [Sphingopyxis sp. R3-92]|uniref:TFIIB-type zinc ribbon-containing protein n=1 Tax=Sphingopyxis sp. R3-92 TaxID=3158553 RepID=UPI003EE7AD2E
MTGPAVGMPCPACKTPLAMSDRQGVEIDYCPQCRGVWLDRGELDKIIERSSAATPAPPAGPAATQQSYPTASHGWDPRYGGHNKGYPKRRKSFLEDLFD